MNVNSNLKTGFLLVALTAPFSMPSTALAERNRNEAEDRAAVIAVRHLVAARVQMNLPDSSDFSVRQAESDELGQTHVRVDQHFKGVPVFGGQMIVHVDNASGDVLEVTDAAHRGIAVKTRPAFAVGKAIAIAHKELQPMGGYNVKPKGELVVFQKGDGGHVLAYHVHTELENPFETRHTDFMISATTGAVLERWDSLETGAATGTGASQYSGSVTLNTNSIAGGFELRDTTRGNGFNSTRNMNHAANGSLGSIYTDSDNAWGDGRNYVEGSSTTAANGETAAVDAHYGLQRTWDYYLTTHGRNGIDNAGSTLINRVHYSNGYDNAFWSDSCFCMTYGDGTSFTTLTSLDVAGHEMTHGVTGRTARLFYVGEAGGLNESTSDIFGTMVEFFARGGTGGNWTIGEQIRNPPLRFMYHPSLDGRSADCWSTTVGSLDVHYSSGVGNHFFYLLSEGSGPSSPTCNGRSVTGIGRSASERIWYRALAVYMTPSTDYKAARTASLNAARDLFGTSSTQYSAVAAAWSAVNVN